MIACARPPASGLLFLPFLRQADPVPRLLRAGGRGQSLLRPGIDRLAEALHLEAEVFEERGELPRALADYDRALAYYKAAYDIDSTYLPTLIGRADLLYKMNDWDGAGKIYQTILVQHRDSQAEADVVRIYYRLGMVRQNLGERKKALNMFEKALEIDPDYARAHAGLADCNSHLLDAGDT